VITDTETQGDEGLVLTVMSRPSAVTLNTLRWCVKLADGLLDRDHPDHPARDALPAAVDWLDQISSTRNETGESGVALAELDLIDTAETAAIIRRTPRRAQQLAGVLGGRKINGTYVFSRVGAIAYAERQRH
jgi:hypothetical protein